MTRPGRAAHPPRLPPKVVMATAEARYSHEALVGVFRRAEDPDQHLVEVAGLGG